MVNYGVASTILALTAAAVTANSPTYWPTYWPTYSPTEHHDGNNLRDSSGYTSSERPTDGAQPRPPAPTPENPTTTTTTTTTTTAATETTTTRTAAAGFSPPHPKPNPPQPEHSMLSDEEQSQSPPQHDSEKWGDSWIEPARWGESTSWGEPNSWEEPTSNHSEWEGKASKRGKTSKGDSWGTSKAGKSLSWKCGSKSGKTSKVSYSYMLLFILCMNALRRKNSLIE